MVEGLDRRGHSAKKAAMAAEREARPMRPTAAPTRVVRLRRSGGAVVQDCDVYIGRACFMVAHLTAHARGCSVRVHAMHACMPAPACAAFAPVTVSVVAPPASRVNAHARGVLHAVGCTTCNAEGVASVYAWHTAGFHRDGAFVCASTRVAGVCPRASGTIPSRPRPAAAPPRRCVASGPTSTVRVRAVQGGPCARPHAPTPHWLRVPRHACMPCTRARRFLPHRPARSAGGVV